MRMSNLSICAMAISSAFLTMTACGRASASETEPQPEAAIFESFTYKGNDDFYNRNPLPDKESFYNPILPGWYSDPSICTNGEGDYYIATSTFSYVPGVPVFHSRDLVNWKRVGHVLTRESQMKNFRHQHVSGGIFAPDLKYNPANKTYYMITTNVGAGNFFVKATDPAGEWSDPIYLPEVQGIDPSFFFDTDGRAYIVNNDDAPDGKPEYPGHRTVRVVEFDTKTDKCIGERKIIVNKGWRPQDKPIWCEGPHIYNIDGTYYLMTAEGGTGDWHSEVIYKGTSPMGPFVPWEGNPILTQRDLPKDRDMPITCAGHADLVQTKEGDWWAVFLACRPTEDGFENLGRETFMLPVEWTDDKWPVITRHGETIPMISRRSGVERGDSVTFGNFEWTDNFDAPALNQEWLSLRGDISSMYSLTSPQGYLTLKCSEVAPTEKDIASYLGRRVQHHQYECATHMVFEPADSTQLAGLLVMKDETHQYQLAKTHDGTNGIVVLRKVDDKNISNVASATLPEEGNGIDLKVVSDGRHYSFHYSTDRGANWTQLADKVDARHTSTAAAGGFTGTTIGPFAVKAKSLSTENVAQAEI